MAEAHMRRSGIAIEAIGKQWQGRVGAKAHAYQTGLFIDAEGDRFVDRRKFLLVLHVGNFLEAASIPLIPPAMITALNPSISRQKPSHSGARPWGHLFPRDRKRTFLAPHSTTGGSP